MDHPVDKRFHAAVSIFYFDNEGINTFSKNLVSESKIYCLPVEM